MAESKTGNKQAPRRRRRRASEEDTPAAKDNPKSAAAEEEKTEQEASSLADAPSAFDPPENLSTMNLWQRIIWVRQNLPRNIEKDKEVGFGGNKYMVLTHEAINVWLKPLLNAAGLVDMVSERELTHMDSMKRQGQKNNIVLYVQGQYDYLIFNADDPNDNHSFVVSGWGEDAGDKGPGKAQTYAFKSGRTKLFSIAAGENEEGRIPDDQLTGSVAPTLTSEQYSALLETCDELFGDDSEAMMKLMCEKLFDGREPLKIPRDMFDVAVEALNKKKAGMDKRAAETGDDIPQAS